MKPPNNELILSCQRSLLGSIPYKLRGLKVKVENNTFYWKGYFDGEPTEEEKEILSIACTEVIADFPIIEEVVEEYINHTFPLKMEMMQFWAFLRGEQD
ncbi:hypothetical protein JOC75_000570 [Metabacillus crassostreae]|uniref:hypothetical protein n=1 Tax=Metabacillus crassostreae TaxID=929098 RepID=UPI00195AE8D8|nr:hypothetical protein [Metabacillus crassostreae]MBM7602600.1 hypothetical protein [Metabacillus crassostreae]